MGGLDISLGGGLMLRKRGTTPRAPGHDIMALVDPATLVAQLQEAPDAIVVLVGERIVGVVPVHPVAHALALLGDACGEAVYALLARVHKIGNAELFDLALGLEAQLLLDLDLDPQALAVEALLPSEFVA